MAEKISVFDAWKIPKWVRWLMGLNTLGLSEAANGIATAVADKETAHLGGFTDENVAKVDDYLRSSKATSGKTASDYWNGAGPTFGAFMNSVTGTAASQAYQTAENDRQLQRDLYLLDQQQSWSERMSNTAIQRQMADAKAAGVNPLYLMGQNSGAGVSNPSGGSAAPAGAVGGNSAAAVSSAIGAVGNIISMILKSK